MAQTSTAAMAPPILLQNPSVPRALGRSAALLAAACLLAHIPLIVNHFAVAPTTTLAMTIASLACMPCAGRLWSAPTTQDCAVAAVLAAIMIGLHLFLVVSMADHTAPSSTVPMPMDHHGAMAEMHGSHQPDMLTDVHHHMAMSQAIGAIFYLATAMATAQILLNVTTIALTVRRIKTRAQPLTGYGEQLRAATVP